MASIITPLVIAMTDVLISLYWYEWNHHVELGVLYRIRVSNSPVSIADGGEA